MAPTWQRACCCSIANVTQQQLVEELGEAESAGTWLGVPEVGVHLLSLPRVHSILCPIQSDGEER